jgi:hypothetical protein
MVFFLVSARSQWDVAWTVRFERGSTEVLFGMESYKGYEARESATTDIVRILSANGGRYGPRARDGAGR